MKKGLLLLTLGASLYALALQRRRAFLSADPDVLPATEPSASPEQSVKPEAQMQEPEPESELCYYIPTGGVWHGDASCHHIAGKPNVVCATVEQAFGAGKTRPCALCG